MLLGIARGNGSRFLVLPATNCPTTAVPQGCSSVTSGCRKWTSFDELACVAAQHVMLGTRALGTRALAGVGGGGEQETHAVQGRAGRTSSHAVLSSYTVVSNCTSAMHRKKHGVSGD